VLLNALEVNTGKTKYMEIGHHWAMMANEHNTIGCNLYEKVKTFKYLVSLLTNQNSILKAGNLCYYSVQTLLSSRILSLRIWKLKYIKQ
jgi:hypothetical protein